MSAAAFDAAKLDPAARAASPFDAEAFLSRLSARHGLLKVSLPVLGRAIQLDIILHVQIEGTRLMLALEGYRARHGDYPVRLEQLVPELFRELPADPTHGGSFVYRLLDGDPHRRGYLLYSTGLDQTDDSGTPYTGPDGPHTALLQPEQTGIDYVINQPRPEGD